MTVLKWVVIVFGVLFFLGAAAMFGVLYWASSVESVHVTEADLAIGGSYPPEEKLALLNACNGRNVTKREDSCTCIADRAGTELSRFLRLVLTATLEGSADQDRRRDQGAAGQRRAGGKDQGGREGIRGAVQRRSCKPAG